MNGINNKIKFLIMKASVWRKISYFFKRKWWQFRNVFKWLPVIWNQFDFDYRYSLDVFKFQLEKQAKFMESNKAHLVNSGLYASKIRTALRLMEKVYNEDYACEYQEKLKDKYGDNVLEWHFRDTGEGNGNSFLDFEYEYWDNKDKVEKDKDKWFRESHEKQKKAHRLLWAFIEHNIQHWWD